MTSTSSSMYTFSNINYILNKSTEIVQIDDLSNPYYLVANLKCDSANNWTLTTPQYNYITYTRIA